MSIRTARIAAAVGLLLGLATTASAHAPLAAIGRTLAIQSCSACHQVTDTQMPPAAVLNLDTLEQVRAPSFAQISQKYGKNIKSLRAFILTPKHPMREQRFLPRDLDAIVAYIRSPDRRH
jgi:mono/diheme cytochrome c family protein